MPEVDAPELSLKRTDVQNELSYHTARALWEIIVPEPNILDARTQGLEDCDSKDADNVDEDIVIENEKLEADRKPAQTKEYPTLNFVTFSKVKDMIPAEMEKWSPRYCVCRAGAGQADSSIQP